MCASVAGCEGETRARGVGQCDGVRGYDERSYGRGMADVYDDWYADVSDVAATVACLADLAAGGPVLELGVGTGRLAIPLAATGVVVHGVDSSPEMLARLATKPGGASVRITEGDMAGHEPAGPFTLVFAAYNTLFNLRSDEAQHACFASVAARLVGGGRFAVEAFVPAETSAADRGGDEVEVRDLAVDRVVLSVSRSEPRAQVASGQFVELSESGGVRLRPWCIRWATVAQLDAMAGQAGLTLEHRWAGWTGETFGGDSPRHVSVWRR